MNFSDIRLVPTNQEALGILELPWSWLQVFPAALTERLWVGFLGFHQDATHEA